MNDTSEGLPLNCSLCLGAYRAAQRPQSYNKLSESASSLSRRFDWDNVAYYDAFTCSGQIAIKCCAKCYILICTFANSWRVGRQPLCVCHEAVSAAFAFLCRGSFVLGSDRREVNHKQAKFQQFSSTDGLFGRKKNSKFKKKRKRSQCSSS